MEIIICLQVFTKIILPCESVFTKIILHFRVVCKDWGRNIYDFASFAIPRNSIVFHFLLNVISKYYSVILRCTLSVSSLSCASCRWSLADLTIVEEIDAKCQHAREIVRSWLPLDRRTCIVHRCNVFFTDSSNRRLQFYRVNFKTRELITAL